MPRPAALLCLATTVVFAALALPFIRKQRRRTRRYEIAEASMEPALTPGDYVIARRSGGHFLLGDVVIFTDPHRPHFELVKRVVGLPGTSVHIAAGRVYIDGDPVPEPWATPDLGTSGTWPIALDEIFVLGDQRIRSSGDSRTIGPLARSAAQWTVRARYWPLRRIGWV